MKDDMEKRTKAYFLHIVIRKVILLAAALIMTVFISSIFLSCEKQVKIIENHDGRPFVAENNEEIASTDIPVKLEEFISAFNENSSYKYSGTILVAKGDEILLDKGFGTSNYRENIPNTPDRVFAIGSLTKSFTAIAIMQLQEKGLLNVKDPISKYIDGNGRGDDITIHQLLTHTSGLPRDGLYSGEQPVSLDENVDYINHCSLLSEPGHEHYYSNAGYILLAAIIEKVSGKSYNDYLKENIFIPLGMDQSRGGIDATYAKDQSIGYEMTTKDPKQMSIYNFTSITGCGNIYSTVEDLYKYTRGIDSNKLVTKESMDAIFTPQWGNWSSGYGYGWGMSEKYGHKRINHKGNIGGGGYNSSIIIYPEDDYVLIFLTNNEDSTALNAVSQTMEAIIYEKEYVIPEKLEEVKVDSQILEEYAGEYDFGGGFLLSVTYNQGKLYSAANDGRICALIPVSETSFYFEEHQWIMDEFGIDKNDNEITLKIRNAGNVLEGKKVKN